MTDKELVELAVKARKNSYSPYSGFKVGAALLSADGNIYTGTNVENASYGETICAERVAFLKAISDGKRNFSAIAIVGGQDDIESFTLPCGACRQVLSEFCQEDFEIVLFDSKSIEICTLGQLFPHSFDKKSIK